MRAEPGRGKQPVPLGQRSTADAKIKQSTSRFDVFFGMAFSNIVMFAIITVTALTIGKHGHHVNISSPAQAAESLKPVAGKLATYIFAMGCIGSGMLAIPVLAGAGAAGLSGLLGKTTGFSKSIREAPVFYGLVLVGMLGGMTLSLLQINPIELLVFVAIVNGVAAAPFLIVTMVVSSDGGIMGKYVNGKLALTLGWATVALMSVAAIALFATGAA
jgi:Mn2+/Fe2+ NRAMP family transporter